MHGFGQDGADGDLPVMQVVAGGFAVAAAKGGEAEQVADGLRGDAEAGGFLLVEAHALFGFRQGFVGLDVGDACHVLYLLFEGVRGCAEGGGVVAGEDDVDIALGFFVFEGEADVGDGGEVSRSCCLKARRLCARAWWGRRRMRISPLAVSPPVPAMV